MRAGLDAQGNVVFDVFVGGGLGRTPVIGSQIYSGLPVQHLLTYLESIMRVYNRYGRRDNKYKARIKILVRAMGADAFKAKVEEDWQQVKDGPSTLLDAEVERMIAAFEPPAFDKLEDATAQLDALRFEHAEFSRWLQHNVKPHKQTGYAVVVLSTKVTGVPTGDVSDETDGCRG